MFEKKLTLLINAIAQMFPEAKFLFDKKDMTAVIFFARSHIMIQENSSEEYPDAVTILCECNSSPKFSALVTLYASKLWQHTLMGDNFFVDEKDGNCYSYIEEEDRPKKDEKWH